MYVLCRLFLFKIISLKWRGEMEKVRWEISCNFFRCFDISLDIGIFKSLIFHSKNRNYG